MNKSATRYIRALQRLPVDRTPVWMMRQAGRYLPEYRALRAQTTDFMTFCKTPELAAEATLQPLQRFELDAAIIFSDILTIPDAMGMDLQFIPGQGPCFSSPVSSLEMIQALDVEGALDNLQYVMKAIALTNQRLSAQTPLIGFAGSPWTVAAYMIEGSGSKMWPRLRKMLYEHPDWLHALLERITQVTSHYLNAQIQAGANAIMVFDTWGGVLSHETYPVFSLQYMQRLLDSGCRQHEGGVIPWTLFTKPAAPWLSLIADTGCDAIGLDSSIDIAMAKKQVGARVALQGNLDPFALYGDAASIDQRVKTIMQSMGKDVGHVFNLGHGIDKDTPIHSVEAMMAAVQRYGVHSA